MSLCLKSSFYIARHSKFLLFTVVTHTRTQCNLDVLFFCLFLYICQFECSHAFVLASDLEDACCMSFMLDKLYMNLFTLVLIEAFHLCLCSEFVAESWFMLKARLITQLHRIPSRRDVFNLH